MAEIHIAEDVRAALDEGRPVVGLESSVIAHGLPRPRNLDAAHRLEPAVRDGGALPATVAVLGGRPTVGVSADELELLASAPDVRKCSRRDLPIVMARREHGATTVAGTLAIMGLAGVQVLATGGLGGVHRGADEIEGALATALDAARRQGISGNRITLFLLDAVTSATGGRSLDANLALLDNNARVGAEVAVALSRVP